MAAMEKSAKIYFQYNHTDACRLSRWTARESYQYLYARPWQKVVHFYADLVCSGRGASSLNRLFPSEIDRLDDRMDDLHGCEETEISTGPCKGRKGRWERVTFKILLSYHGGSFDGWQKQPGLNTVQGVVEQSLGTFVDEKKAKQLKEKSMPVEGCAVVAGRTDKGVTALQQVCSFCVVHVFGRSGYLHPIGLTKGSNISPHRNFELVLYCVMDKDVNVSDTWRKDVKGRDIINRINEAAPGKIRALQVTEVSRIFHPNFAAKWRRYLYILPLHGNEESVTSSANIDWSKSYTEWEDDQINGQLEDDDKVQQLSMPLADEDDELGTSGVKPRSFTVSKVDQLLRQLEGKLLSYKMFARDTKASRNIGPATECYMFHARAATTKLHHGIEDYENGQRVMCVELVANRFLRKMVRVLVATAIREAAAGANDDALVKLMDATCRRATAPPAPPEGLCLVNIGYGEFREEICLIR